MVITGNNFQRDMNGYPYSYYFSIYNHCWGWAAWRRAWRLYDDDMRNYGRFLESGALKRMSAMSNFEAHWKRCFDEVRMRTLDTWDYVWTYSCWANSGLTCTPRVNLVSNIGFGREATRTFDGESHLANIPTQSLERALVHPAVIATSVSLDDNVARDVCGVKPYRSPIRRAGRHLSRLLQRVAGSR